MSRNTEWKEVRYPIKKGLLPLFLLILFLIYIFLSFYLIGVISEQIPDLVVNLPIIYRSVSFNWLKELLLLVMWGYLIFHTIKLYKKIMLSKKSIIANNLRYMIHTLRLYDEEIFETIKDNKIVNEKNIVRVIRIYYKESEKYVYVRIMRDGDRFTTMNISANISSALGLELEKSKENPKFVEYTFLKFKDVIKQYLFSSQTFDRSFFKNIATSIIPLTNTQSFDLKKNTNMGLYGRTGAGKTIALQWYLYNAVAKGCATFPNTFLYIVDGKGADLFSLGELLKQELGENVSVGQTPNSLAKLSREFVEIMDARFEVIKESSTLNADAYDLGMIPNFLFIDELASIRDSCGSSKQGKEVWNEILQNLGLIARKGRQAACHLCISTQDPNAENIPVELRNQISSVLYLGNPSVDRTKMAFAMCELENVPTISGRKGEGLFYADGNNLLEPEITVVPFVDLQTKQEFVEVIKNIKPKFNYVQGTKNI